MKRLTREYKIDNDYMLAKLGTVNKDNPQVFYLSAKAWLYPLYESEYELEIHDVINRLKYELKELLYHNNLSSKYIFNFDVNYESIEALKYSYCTLEIILKQKDNILEFKEINNKFNSIFNTFLNDFHMLLKNKNILLKMNKEG